jgi:hypothetical protein
MCKLEEVKTNSSRKWLVGLRRLKCGKIQYIAIDEFRSSKLCCKCSNVLSNCESLNIRRLANERINAQLAFIARQNSVDQYKYLINTAIH